MTLLVAACDVVERYYPTRAAAEKDRLFERGWLPEIIPPSSRRIKTRNDLDLNTSTGEFYFDNQDLTGFLKHLTRLPSRDHKAYKAYSHEKWVFLIDSEKNYCRYNFRL